MRTARVLVAWLVVMLTAATTGTPSLGAQTDFAPEPESVALRHLESNAKLYGLSGQDLASLRVTALLDVANGAATNVIIQQFIGGVEVLHAVSNVVVTRQGEIVTVGDRFVSVDAALGNGLVAPAVKEKDAVSAALTALALEPSLPIAPIATDGASAGTTSFTDGGVAAAPIVVRPAFVAVERSIVRVWDVEVREASSAHWWRVQIDAMSGVEVGRIDYVDEEGYHVYPPPIEAPSFAVPTPPGDGRVTVVDPFDPVASPFGWHDTDAVAGPESTLTIGNNVNAFADRNGDNLPDGGSQPDGGAGLTFAPPLDLTQQPLASRDAAVVNLFYWNNLLHDVLYRYGFDEAAGNFQVNNYGNGGIGGDAVLANAQDGADVGERNNAKFATPPDGVSPAMSMYLWNTATPMLDGDLDNGIIVHEYGHGLSNRLVGGPSNTACLDNAEQMGEGWSDYLTLMFTMSPGDVGPTGRGIGTYALAQPTTGPGIRAFPYSTDLGVDPRTYDDIKTAVIPHGVGSTWTSMLWEMTWSLIDEHGFDPDLAGGDGGNNRALQLVVDGLKLTPCSPGFVDGRNAILDADLIVSGGANRCLIWKAFAKRGLGFGAVQGSTSSVTDGSESFDLPPSCRPLILTKSAPSEVTAGAILPFVLSVTNNDAVVHTDISVVDDIPTGTSLSPGSLTCPASVDAGVLTWELASLDPGVTEECAYSVLVDPAPSTTTLFGDDFEDDLGSWIVSHGEGSIDWSLVTTAARSGATSAFAADPAVVTDQYLTLGNAVPIEAATQLSFWHRYATEQDFDGAVVELSTDDGATWTDAGPLMTTNVYNGILNNVVANPLAGRPAYTGTSSGFVKTVVDLTSLSGASIKVRFRFASDASVGATGWWIDDIHIGDIVSIDTTATATSAQGASSASSTATTVLSPPATPRCNGLEVTVDLAVGQQPTEGDDVILGSPDADLIEALGGDDVICGGGGDDTVVGGDGNDWIDGGSGDDTIFGQDGDDTITGGPGADLISGNAGADTLGGSDGADEIYGGSGADTIDGGVGDDILGGSSGYDLIDGGDDDDLISGGSDVDGAIHGGLGNDLVNGGGGDDLDVRGNEGDDSVSGNGGNDIVFGDEGNDAVRGGNGDDTVNGGAGDDFVAGNPGVDICNGDGGTNTIAASCEFADVGT